MQPSEPTHGSVRDMDIVDPRIESYMADRLERFDEPVVLDMEAEARANGFPIVGRNVGVTLEVLARSAGATRVVELGSGFGYSAYWFARATGSGGEVHLTDGDPDNERRARDYLGRANLLDRVTYHVGDAVTSLKALEGEFDIVYCDIDKDGYPDAWRAARDRVRVGGLYICDNVLWYGRVTGAEPVGDDRERRNTAGVIEHNQLVAGDERYISTIVPTRDGVMVAVRIA
jgi:caffeoyl-CoA O-methyltransferase